MGMQYTQKVLDGISLVNEGKWKDQLEDPFFALLDLISSLEPVCCRLPHPTGIFLGFPTQMCLLSSDTHNIQF